MESRLVSVSLRRLQVFLVVCETLHMAKAAERLGVAQPALSQQIRSLEQALGVRLFNRRKRGIDLTAVGETCRIEAEKLLRFHAGMIDSIRRTSRGQMGRINLGYVASAMFGRRFLEQLKTMHERFPDVELSLSQSSLPVLLPTLEAGGLDVALVCAPVAVDPPLTHRIHSRQDLVVALPKEHPLAALKKIPISRLANEPLIALLGPDDIGIMQVATQLAVAGGVKLNPKWQAPEFNGVLALVSAGLGYGIVPKDFTQIASRDIAFRPLQEAGANAEYWLVWHEQRVTPALDQFIEIVTKRAI